MDFDSTLDDFLSEALRLKPFIRDTATMITQPRAMARRF